ncbi:MAG: hypothetical protein LUD51_07620 [Clostridia bacterium]|nr:hypothetical protein [Clostridia bacterium]
MAFSYIEEYDHIYVTVRKDRVRELKYCYEQFGWKEVEREEHRVYANLVDMTFRRPHKIADKDELQLLQVHLEEALNVVGKYEKAPRRKTKAFVWSLSVLAFLLLAIGLPLGIVPVTVTYKVIGFAMAALGVIIIPLVSVFGVKLWHYEKRVGERRLKIARDLVIGICHNAKEIREKGEKAFAQVLEPAKQVVEKIVRRAHTEDEGEELLAKVMDISIKKAIAERKAYAASHAADESAASAADYSAANSVTVIPAGDTVVVIESDPQKPSAKADESAKEAGNG